MNTRLKTFLLIIIFCAVVLGGLVLAITVARSQGYLPPERYRQIPQARPEDNPAGPNEYYAEDWIVYDAQHRVMCKDPYIRLDLKTVECVSTEKWR